MCFILLILTAAFNASLCAWPPPSFHTFISTQESSLDLWVGSHANPTFPRMIWWAWCGSHGPYGPKHRVCPGGSWLPHAWGSLILWVRTTAQRKGDVGQLGIYCHHRQATPAPCPHFAHSSHAVQWLCCTGCWLRPPGPSLSSCLWWKHRPVFLCPSAFVFLGCHRKWPHWVAESTDVPFS